MGVSCSFKQDFKKIMLMTKLTILLNLLFVLQLSATVYSQSTYLTVESQNKTVKEILAQIEENSEFRFFYNEKFIDLERKVDFTIENQKIDQIMDKLFNESEITYQVMENNLIVITPSKNDLPADQQKGIKGKVTEENGNPPLPGINVDLKPVFVWRLVNEDFKRD